MYGELNSLWAVGRGLKRLSPARERSPLRRTRWPGDYFCSTQQALGEKELCAQDEEMTQNACMTVTVHLLLWQNILSSRRIKDNILPGLDRKKNYTFLLISGRAEGNRQEISSYKR